MVADAAADREELLGRGVEASELMSLGDQDGSTFFGFSDPDGNTWAVQELKVRATKPDPAGGSGAVRDLTRRAVDGVHEHGQRTT